MSIFKKLFGYDKKENTNTRTFANMERGLKTGYIEDFQRANNAYLADNLSAASQHINSAIEKSDISDWQHYAFRAKILEDQQQFSQAITDYNKAIEFSNSPTDVYALYHQIGICYLNLGNNSKAEEFYTASIDLKAKHPNSEYYPDLEGMMGGVTKGLPYERLYNNRANARKNQGKLQEAFEDCEKALEYNPNYSNSYLLAGQIHQLSGNISEAIRLVKHSISMGNPNAHRVLLELEKTQPKSTSQSSNLDPDTLLQQSLKACDDGNYNKAIQYGNELLEIHNSPAGFFALGLVYAVIENWQLAKYNCLEAYKYFPTVPDNLNRLGVACCFLGEIEDGLEYFQKGIKLGDSHCRDNYNYWKNRF